MDMHEAATGPALMAIERGRHLLERAMATGRGADYLAARLHPEMFECGTQIQTVTIFALRATFPLVGRDWPRTDLPGDPEGLAARLDWSAERIGTLTSGDFAGAETRPIAHRAGHADLVQPGAEYLLRFALPNLWFHLSMAFAILRAEGLDIGKADFDGLHAYPAGFSFVR